MITLKLSETLRLSVPALVCCLASALAATAAESDPAMVEDEDPRPRYDRLVDRFGYFVVGSSGIESWHRVNASRELDTDFSFNISPRAHGEASLPFLRVDFGYQDIDTVGDAFDYRIEFGYGPFAIQARETRYDSDSPIAEQDIVQIHGLYRMSYAALLEIDLGIGALILEQPDQTESFSFTVPVLLHPSNHYGLEFRPAWSRVNGERVTDYDLNLLIGARFFSVRLGYRWVETVTDEFNGPQIGASLRW
jgi:hypothetical protein